MLLKIILSFILSNFLYGQLGYEIAHKVYSKDEVDDLTCIMKMKLINSKNKIKNYKMKSLSIDGSRKQIIWFMEPSHDKGISFYKVEYEDRENEMKMWLPAFKKIRRISSKKKGDSFMGSDLSYEDLSRRNLKDYTFKKLEDRYYNDKSYYIIEITPKEKTYSSYEKHISWVDKKSYNIIKEDSFGINGDILKEKELFYKSFNGYELIEKVKVYNPISKHSTIIDFTEIEINSDINERFFHEKYMKRIPNI